MSKLKTASVKMKEHVIFAGEIANLGLDALNDALNGIPMGALDYRYSIEALQAS